MSGWVLEFFFWLFYALTGHLGHFFPLKKVIKGNRSHPIVLIHGWMTRTVPFFLLKKRLEALGFSVFMSDLGWQTGHIEPLSAELIKFISKHKIKDPIIVAHSMGGLIAHNAIQKHGLKAHMLITMGTPFTGTPFARFFKRSGASQDMLPDSDFIKGISKTKVPTVSIFAKKDQYVPPHNSVVLWSRCVEVPIYGHTALIYDKKAFKMLASVLGERLQ